MADDTGRAVVQPRHPDKLVEAVRWSITEGAVCRPSGGAAACDAIRPSQWR